MITIGSDAHLKTSTLCVLDHDGEKLVQKKIENSPVELLQFVRRFSGPKQFAMEANYNWSVFYELLKNEVDDFHLLHPSKLKAIIDSQSKCDNHDAHEIAHLTHINYIPKSYKADAATRQFRRVVRTRIKIAQRITQIKNQITAIINANIFYVEKPKNFKSLFCKRGHQYLSEITLPKQERFVVDSLLRELEFLRGLKEEFEAYIKRIKFKQVYLEILQSVPAMNGNILKYIILAEIDSIERFRNSDSLVAYAGLVPRDRSSGEKIRKGKLRTGCNEFLKWGILEAVTAAIRKDKSLRELYRTKKHTNNASAARVCVARKLLKIIYHVLKEKRPYYSVSANRG